MKDISITFMLIGLVAGFCILQANDRGVIVDDVVADMDNTTAWELAFGVYMMFLIGGISAEMLTVRKGYFHHRKDYERILLNIIIFIASIFILTATASGLSGGLSTAIINMRDELYGWYQSYALVYIVYIIHAFIVRR